MPFSGYNGQGTDNISPIIPNKLRIRFVIVISVIVVADVVVVVMVVMVVVAVSGNSRMVSVA